MVYSQLLAHGHRKGQETGQEHCPLPVLCDGLQAEYHEAASCLQTVGACQWQPTCRGWDSQPAQLLFILSAFGGKKFTRIQHVMCQSSARLRTGRWPAVGVRHRRGAAHPSHLQPVQSSTAAEETHPARGPPYAKNRAMRIYRKRRLHDSTMICKGWRALLTRWRARQIRRMRPASQCVARCAGHQWHADRARTPARARSSIFAGTGKAPNDTGPPLSAL